MIDGILSRILAHFDRPRLIVSGKGFTKQIGQLPGVIRIEQEAIDPVLYRVIIALNVRGYAH